MNDLEVVQRMAVNGSGIFQKEKEQQADETTVDADDEVPAERRLVDFNERHGSLRQLCLDLATPRLRAVWITRFNVVYPNFTYGNGLKVTKFEDFIQAFITEPHDKKMRGMHHYCCNELWGKSNADCASIEGDIMDKAGLEYTDKLVDGKKCKTRRKSGCVKSLVVRKKQTDLVEVLKRLGRDQKQEVPYSRLISNPMEGVVRIEKVLLLNFGYNGYCGYCVGHVHLLMMDQPRNPLVNPLVPAQ